MTSSNKVRYPVYNDRDELYGLVVTSVGYQSVEAGEVYPPKDIHPNEYIFSQAKGRILQEYQLLYIVSGSGTLNVEELGEFEVCEGDLFVVHPNVRHTYSPNSSTGWAEYWVGFKGKIIDNVIKRGFITPDTPIFKIGYNERIIDLYKKIYNISLEEREGYQQAVAGIVFHLLGLVMYRDSSTNFKDEEIITKIDLAKFIMREHVYDKIDLELISTKLNMSYSNFRKIFKKIVGVSPLYYFNEMRIDEVKLLLSTTNLSIKEISFRISYDSPEAFTVYFKKKVGVTPTQYRQLGYVKK